MRALLIANSIDADPGFVGERFRHHGFAFTECHREVPTEWPTLAGVDQVVLLGSEWSVYWDEVQTSVRAECALVKNAHEQGIPVFGICFGSQIVAHALGGSVARAARPEVGWHSVRSDRPADIDSGPWMQWHFDAFTTPPDFREIARSDSGPQAIVGARTFATQFHPEATETIVARWSAGEPADLARLGLTAQGLMDDTRSNVGRSRRAAERLVDWYLNDVVGASSA